MDIAKWMDAWGLGPRSQGLGQMRPGPGPGPSPGIQLPPITCLSPGPGRQALDQGTGGPKASGTYVFVVDFQILLVRITVHARVDRLRNHALVIKQTRIEEPARYSQVGSVKSPPQSQQSLNPLSRPFPLRSQVLGCRRLAGCRQLRANMILQTVK